MLDKKLYSILSGNKIIIFVEWMGIEKKLFYQ